MRRGCPFEDPRKNGTNRESPKSKALKKRRYLTDSKKEHANSKQGTCF